MLSNQFINYDSIMSEKGASPSINRMKPNQNVSYVQVNPTQTTPKNNHQNIFERCLLGHIISHIVSSQFPKQVITFPKYYQIPQNSQPMNRKYLLKHPSQPHLPKDHPSLLNNSHQLGQCFRPTFHPINNTQLVRIKTEGLEPRSTSKEFGKVLPINNSLKKCKYFFPISKQNSKNAKCNNNIIRNTYNYNQGRVSDFPQIKKTLDTTVIGNNRFSEAKLANKKQIHKINIRAKHKICSPTALDYSSKAQGSSFQAHPFKNGLKLHQLNPLPYRDIGIDDIMIQQLIGSGTFGKVFKAKLKSTGQKIALKKVQQDKKYKTRQLQMLEMVDSPFIIRTFATFTLDQGKYDCLHIAMQPFDQNFYQLLKLENLTPIQTKCYVYQMLRGLLYLHNRGICHRDLKPHNMLVKSKRLVICDLGSAKILRPGEQNIFYICSRCYRAPQLIFQSKNYSTQIDMWSLGCILLQILNDRPLFIADSSLNHILEVIKILGTPSKEDVRQMNPNYDLSEYDLPWIRPKSLKNLFPQCDSLFIDLVQKMLRYSPERRLTAAEALTHPYFEDLRNERVYRNIAYFQGLQLFFDFQKQILPISVREKLVPKWWRHNKK